METTNARKEILNRLRRRQRDVTHPPAWRSRRTFPDLAAQFTKALAAVKGEVKRAASLEAAWAVLDGLLRDVGAERVVVNGDAPLDGVAWPGRDDTITWHHVGQTGGDLRAFCAQADVGVSGADAALAETGTVIVRTGPGRSRLATLLPPIHVALVPIAALTTDLFTWIAAQTNPLSNQPTNKPTNQPINQPTNTPSNLVLISGPSKTADIEQTLAIGVHGPKRLIVILYD